LPAARRRLTGFALSEVWLGDALVVSSLLPVPSELGEEVAAAAPVLPLVSEGCALFPGLALAGCAGLFPAAVPLAAGVD